MAGYGAGVRWTPVEFGPAPTPPPPPAPLTLVVYRPEERPRPVWALVQPRQDYRPAVAWAVVQPQATIAGRDVAVVGKGSTAYLAALAIARADSSAQVFLYHQGARSERLVVLTEEAQKLLTELGVKIADAKPVCHLLAAEAKKIDFVCDPSTTAGKVVTLSETTLSVSAQQACAAQRNLRRFDTYSIGPPELDILGQRVRALVLTSPIAGAQGRDQLLQRYKIDGGVDRPIQYARALLQTTVPFNMTGVLDAKSRVVPFPDSESGRRSVTIVTQLARSDIGPFVSRATENPMVFKDTAELAALLNSPVGTQLRQAFDVVGARNVAAGDAGSSVRLAWVQIVTGPMKLAASMAVAPDPAQKRQAQVVLVGDAAVEWPTEFSSVESYTLNAIDTVAKALRANTPPAALNTILTGLQTAVAESVLQFGVGST